MPFNLLVLVCFTYVFFLFLVAYLVERRAARGRVAWLRSPLVYTLSLSIYCTAWTFYGAVGYAARSGLEFLTIYLGPTLVFIGWWWVLRKLVRIGRQHRVTSIGDLISSRYGKSNLLGVMVTVLAVVAATPYIALQLQSVTLSFGVFASDTPEGWALPDRNATAIWVAVGLALFTVLFGTRNLDAKEQHHGIVTAIAVEAVVKLVALLAVGVFVVWGLADGPADMAGRITASKIAAWNLQPGRWFGIIFLAAAAVICLPRMFQVLVVEDGDERHLARASWAFPLYLFLMRLFIVPIAVLGLERLPAGSNPDMFVLTLPLAAGQGGLALLAFLGGFFQRHVNGDYRGDCAVDHGIEPHCHAVVAAISPANGGVRRFAADRSVGAQAVYRGGVSTGLRLFSAVGRIDGTGSDWINIVCRCGAGFACDAGGYLLARSHAGGRCCGFGYWVCDLGLYDVFAKFWVRRRDFRTGFF